MEAPHSTKKRIPYKSKLRIYTQYWQVYGGWAALVNSFYFHFAVLLTLIMWGHWTKEGWWDMSLSVLPGIIGFSIGGFALLLAFGDDKFQKLMANAEVRTSNAFLDLCGAFTHFVLMQFLAIVVALVAKGTFVEPPQWAGHWPNWIWAIITGFRYLLWFSGELLFIYAMLCGAAATMRIFRLAKMFSKIANAEDPDSSHGE